MTELAIDETAPAPGSGGPEPGRPSPEAPTTRPWTSMARPVLSGLAAFVVFALLLVAKGINPIDGYQAMWDSVFRDTKSFGDVLVRLTPYLLASLAVVLPARAGLFNIGGEGQLLVGAIGAMAMANALDHGLGRTPTLILMALAAMTLAGLWAGIAAVLRHWTNTNEAISTLLCNYLAALFLSWLVFGRWKDPRATGFPRSRQFGIDERLPLLWGRVHIGILVAIAAAIVVWAALRWSTWGFRLQVLGGNAEAARRAGFHNGRLAASALMCGGALAGLGGMLQVTGVEGQVSAQMMTGYGFTGVLAAWMVRQRPLWAIGSSTLLAAISVGGNGLKIRAGLSAGSVNILMALLLLAVLGWGRRPERAVA